MRHTQRTKVEKRVMTMSIDTTDEEFIYMADHVIDGKNLLPATGYLFYIWKMMATINSEQYTDMPILFENVSFLRATVLSKQKEVDLIFTIQKGITINKINFILILHNNILNIKIYFISYFIFVIK